MALEPAWLEGNRTTGDRPKSSVCGCGMSTARIHPLHAKGKCVVRDQIISSPSRVRENSVGIHHGQTHRGDKGEAPRKHGEYDNLCNRLQLILLASMGLQENRRRLEVRIEKWTGERERKEQVGILGQPSFR